MAWRGTLRTVVDYSLRNRLVSIGPTACSVEVGESGKGTATRKGGFEVKGKEGPDGLRRTASSGWPGYGVGDRCAESTLSTQPLRINPAVGTGKKGVRTLLCEAPFGPFRQKSPDPFFHLPGNLRRESLQTLPACNQPSPFSRNPGAWDARTGSGAVAKRSMSQPQLVGAPIDVKSTAY